MALTNRVIELVGDFSALIAEQRPLRIKCGFDPTTPELHLGHAVLLRKLREFQDAGHQAIVLIGDFTAKIGDPSGRNTLRPPLSEEDIADNVKSFQNQLFRILDVNRTTIRFNSEWFGKDTASSLIRLMASVTVSQILEREDFDRRFHEQRPIHLHELVYPLLQGFDSVMLNADVELGGTDQKFNLLMGRELQRKHRQQPQVLMMLPLIFGTYGVDKMSKSLNNHIGIAEPPSTQFAKLMSISDDLVPSYRSLLTDCQEIADEHPMVGKKRIAHAIVSWLHGQEKAESSQAGWEAHFQSGGQAPREIETVKIVVTKKVASDDGWILRLDKVLVAAGLAVSNREANQKIKEGAVDVGGVVWKNRGNGFWVPKNLPIIKIMRLGRNWKRVEISVEA